MLIDKNKRTTLAGLCGCALLPFARGTAHAAGEPVGGCYLSAGDYDSKVAPSSVSFGYAGKEETFGSSGDRLFDRALAITLVKLSNLFGVLPAFAFFDDSKGMNAYATSRVTQQDRPDGTVVFGLGLLSKMLDYGDSGPARVAAVCAHEFAHIKQMRSGTRDKLLGPNGQVLRLELHADMMTGYFAGMRRTERDSFPAADVAHTAYSIGDHNVNSRSHHGTPKQRGEAVRLGYKMAYEQDLSISEAFRQSMAVVYDL